MFVRQVGNGDYYICTKLKKSGKRNVFRNTHIISFVGTKKTGCGSITIGSLSFPKEFIGKKIRIKIEVAENVE